MALALQKAVLVRQKTYMINRDSGIFYALKALFLHLATNKSNPDLQLVNVDGPVTSSDGSAVDQVIANAPCTLYAVYLKKAGTVAVWFKATDHATVGASNGTADISHKVTTLANEDLFIYADGHLLANGLTLRQDTTATGATRTLAANSLTGFIIIGE